jgi:hypothetical protein
MVDDVPGVAFLQQFQNRDWLRDRNNRSISSFSGAFSDGQTAISSRVRRQPMHQP